MLGKQIAGVGVWGDVRLRPFSLGLCLLSLWPGWVRGQDATAGQDVTPDKVSILLDEWHDVGRGNRSVPVKIYYPKSGDGPFPVIIVSHGLGGSREGLKFEGEYWAAHGYVSIHLQHIGSDSGVVKDAAPGEKLHAMMTAFTPEQLSSRCKDVVFALDHLKDIQGDADSPLHGKLDLDRIAMAGHSFGAITTEYMCGELTQSGHRINEPRVKVGIAFSPSPPRVGDAKVAFSKVTVPMFHWTGTLDTVMGDTTADKRRIPYDSINGSDQFLVIFTGADHMIFNGRLVENAQLHPNDEKWKSLIQVGTTAFLDAYLKDDAKAKAYLTGGDFAGEIKPYGTFEQKLKK